MPALMRAAGLGRAGVWRVSLGIALGAGAILAAAGLLATSGYLISKASEQPVILTLTIAIVGVRFFGVSRAVLRYLERLVLHDAALRAAASLRVAVFRGVSRGSPADPRESASGDRLARLVDDVDRLQDVLVRIAGPPLIAVATIVALSGVAYAIVPATGLLLVLGLGLGALTTLAMGHLGNVRAGLRESPARGEMATRLTDVVVGAPELALNGAGRRQEDAVMAADVKLVAAGRRSAWARGLTTAWGMTLAGIVVAAVLAASGEAVASGRIDGVVVAALALLALAAFEGITPLGGAGERLAPVLGAASRVHELVLEGQRPTVVPAAGSALPRATALAIVEGRVSYSHGGEMALDGLSLTLTPGRRVALVGPSGAGKSTAAYALAGLVPLASGRVALGGRDIATLGQDRLPEHVRLLAQDAYVFAASIADNVRLARPSASEADVREAIARVGALDWVDSLPAGLDTVVGEDGVLISGGQRQRLMLARALISGAGFLIFDEPTVHLSDDDAREMIHDIEARTGSAGVLVITHRLAGLDSFDEIVVLEAGRVIERGDHRALMEAGGWYARGVAAQRPVRDRPTTTASD